MFSIAEVRQKLSVEDRFKSGVGKKNTFKFALNNNHIEKHELCVGSALF